MTPAVLFRCDASTEIGFGHVMRCLALADVLRLEHGLEAVFVMRQDERALAVVRAWGVAIHAGPSPRQGEAASAWLETALADTRVQALILDVRERLARETLEAARRRGVLIVTIDDPGDARLLADLAFYPPIPQVRRWDWSGFAGRRYSGWEWVILRREFATPPVRPNNPHPVVLVAMGGSDPAGLTIKALEALAPVSDLVDLVVLVGPGFTHERALDHVCSRLRPRVSVERDPGDVRALFSKADLAIASFGMTAYELAATGVPAIHICLTDDHAESASAFAEAGVAVNLGVCTVMGAGSIGDAATTLLRDSERRAAMSLTARRLVDGRGASRVADVIVQALSERAREEIETGGRPLRT